MADKKTKPLGKQPAPKVKGREGRPTDYREEYNEVAYRLCLMGATDKTIAEVLCVSERAINLWKDKYPEFMQSIARGKLIADSKVAEALYNRACGASHPETRSFVTKGGEIIHDHVTRHHPPDTTAISLWLRNRQAELWRDRVEIEHTDADLPERLEAARRRVREMRQGESGGGDD